ncbi:hypothetical protein VP01_2125g5 [Puccinia sorghi]|uniref:Uncharacterized protein n=1 Tax=Puccinia sorghi TaxID=27349 RepID=A0A0L6V9U6_9BASI|nr:hypothetical protein VP01_2125g5 [Puccinia sorghi]
MSKRKVLVQVVMCQDSFCFEINHQGTILCTSLCKGHSIKTGLARCLKTLKHHQIKALQFLTNNKSLEGNNLDDIWDHRDNNWIWEKCDPSNLLNERIFGL